MVVLRAKSHMESFTNRTANYLLRMPFIQDLIMRTKPQHFTSEKVFLFNRMLPFLVFVV